MKEKDVAEDESLLCICLLPCLTVKGILSLVWCLFTFQMFLISIEYH